MKLNIHRGANQIGGSCVELSSAGKRLIIDLGLPLDAEENDAKYLPDIPGLKSGDDSLLGIIISHPHLDHFGLLYHISDDIPVIMGKAARSIVTAAAPFIPGRWPTDLKGRDLKSGVSFKLGPFKITPYLVDHSGYDAYSLLIEADGKRVFYSGDLRMHGRKGKLTRKLMANPPSDIDILLMEGSVLGSREFSGSFPSEDDIENQLADIFRKNSGVSLVHASSQNIDRIVSVFRATKKARKRLIMDLYSAVILEATGNPKIPQSDWPEVALFIPQRQRVKIKNNRWFDLLKRHSKNRIFIEELGEAAGNSVILFRGNFINDLNKAGMTDKATYIYSMWEGYWQRDNNKYMRDWIKEKDIPKLSVHTSGHAAVDDLKKFAGAINASKVVPIHTFEPERYREIFDNVELHQDGESWEVL